jgi:transcriptional regulator with XRE-family HTH domain
MTTVGGGASHANALQRARVAANISQRIAARHVGIAPQLLNEAEHDLAVLPQAVIDKLTAFYTQVIADDLKVEKCPSCGNMVRAHRQCRCMRGKWEAVK